MIRIGTVVEKIAAAAHEVQRPVFYAIGIIILAYLPIFTLQHVEGRLFRPMAWTVAFALLGALIFALTLAPVLSSFLFTKTHPGVAQPSVRVGDEDIPETVAVVRPSPLGYGWHGVRAPCYGRRSRGRGRDRLGISAAPR